MAVILLVTHRPPTDAQVDRAAKVAGARRLSELPGLRWKVWLAPEPHAQDEETNADAGGIYLFDDAESADAWAVRVAELLAASANVSIRRFAIDEELSLITRATLETPVAL